MGFLDLLLNVGPCESLVRQVVALAINIELMSPICKRCQDTGWVCERHLGRPWSIELPHGFEFVVPCPDCRGHVSQSTRRIRCKRQPMSVAESETMRKKPRRNT
jgi:hypothetical protein